MAAVSLQLSTYWLITFYSHTWPLLAVWSLPVGTMCLTSYTIYTCIIIKHFICCLLFLTISPQCTKWKKIGLNKLVTSYPGDFNDSYCFHLKVNFYIYLHGVLSAIWHVSWSVEYSDFSCEIFRTFKYHMNPCSSWKCKVMMNCHFTESISHHFYTSIFF